MDSSVISVSVPGSTSNCGPGFDTLGIGIGLSNSVSVRLRTDGRIEADDASSSVALEMVRGAATAWAARARRPSPGFSFSIQGGVPAARGLGSSVTIRAGIAAALEFIESGQVDPMELVKLVTALEGHPDNAAASVLGGFCVPLMNGESICREVIRFPVPGHVRMVIASPELEILTEESRRRLPEQIGFYDVVENINQASFLVAAFASGRFEALPGTWRDHLHEPFRLRWIPGGSEAIAAGVAAGAWTGWLSGSGSSVLCLSHTSRAESVAAAMDAAFREKELRVAVRILEADNDGLRLDSDASRAS